MSFICFNYDYKNMCKIYVDYLQSLAACYNYNNSKEQT